MGVNTHSQRVQSVDVQDESFRPSEIVLIKMYIMLC